MKRELLIGALLTIKLCVFVLRAGYPMRNPLSLVKLSHSRKPITTVKRVVYIFLGIILIVVVFVLRTMVVIWKKRAEDNRKIDRMGGNYYAEAFNNLSDSDDLSDGKKADWDIHLESDNNRVYGRD